MTWSGAKRKNTTCQVGARCGSYLATGKNRSDHVVTEAGQCDNRNEMVDTMFVWWPVGYLELAEGTDRQMVAASLRVQ